MLKSLAPLIVFDLDGTLVDSAPDLVDTLNVILAREGHAPVSLEAGRKMVGSGARVMIRRGLESQGASVTDARLEEMFAEYLAYYEDHLTDKTVFYPGAEAALDRLTAAGWSLAILTNKYEKPAIKLVEALGARTRFKVIAGQDTFAVSKPNAGALFDTIDQAGGDRRQSIMVGDTITDVSTAQNAKIPVIAVDFGYADRPVASMNPDRIISHFDQLSGAVAVLKAGFSVAV
ncbi:HAD-IA family hydrolase [Beijerinckia sp. L45]|uniref:HAD-IA family hydrolase n=1 Tax=Beijerinckia sp. L45 TaxID=1641855 RepID=UPI00131AD558|nr:HAD-IA family hydrolase [Beijerinckia sp. L45]